MNIILKLITPYDGNPFRNYPELKGIWTQDLAILAEESIDEAFGYYKKNIDIGEIYLIYGDTNGKQTLLGISGYFPVKEDYSEFMLRWHGLLKEHQNFGYSKNGISFLANHIKEKYPQAEKLKEFMPIIDSYASIRSYFECLGFKKDGNAEIVDWSEHKWQEFSLDLPKFVQQKIKKPSNKNQSHILFFLVFADGANVFLK